MEEQSHGRTPAVSHRAEQPRQQGWGYSHQDTQKNTSRAGPNIPAHYGSKSCHKQTPFLERHGERGRLLLHPWQRQSWSSPLTVQAPKQEIGAKLGLRPIADTGQGTDIGHNCCPVSPLPAVAKGCKAPLAPWTLSQCTLETHWVSWVTQLLMHPWVHQPDPT